MNCRDVEARLSAYLDGELDDAAASALRGHLRLCEACRRLAEDHAAIVDAVAHLAPAEPPPALWDGVLARLGEAEVADARRPTLWLWWQRLRPQLLPATLGVAAVATVALWMWKRGEEPITEVAERAAHVAPRATASIPRTATNGVDPAVRGDRQAGDRRDVLAAMADEARDLDDAYRAAADDLAALADGDRARWPAATAHAFDARVAALRAAVAAAAPGEARERAWQRLVAYLQQVVTTEPVALAGGSR